MTTKLQIFPGHEKLPTSSLLSFQILLQDLDRGVKVKRKTVSRQKISDEKKFLQQDLQSCVKSNVKKQKCLCFAAFLDFCSAGKTQVQKARQNIRKHTQCPNSFCLGKNHAKNWNCFYKHLVFFFDAFPILFRVFEILFKCF